MTQNYTPQNNWRTNTLNYNIDAFCVERILKTNLNFSDIFDAILPSETAKENGRKMSLT